MTMDLDLIKVMALSLANAQKQKNQSQTLVPLVRGILGKRISDNSKNKFLLIADKSIVSKIINFIVSAETMKYYIDCFPNNLKNLFTCLINNVFDVNLIIPWIQGIMRNSIYKYQNIIKMKEYMRKYVHHVGFDNDSLEDNVFVSQQLICHGCYDEPLSQGIFPLNLTHLKLWDTFNQPLVQGILPQSLISLEFGSHYNGIILNALPSNLMRLQFGYSFNRSLKGILPHGLEVLILGDSFNQPLNPGDLPLRLRSLRFGDQFNQLIEKDVLPQTLEFLEFGIGFNQNLTDLLPDSLTHLVVSAHFYDSNLSNYPSNLCTLTRKTFFRSLIFDIICKQKTK